MDTTNENQEMLAKTYKNTLKLKAYRGEMRVWQIFFNEKQIYFCRNRPQLYNARKLAKAIASEFGAMLVWEEEDAGRYQPSSNSD